MLVCGLKDWESEFRQVQNCGCCGNRWVDVGLVDLDWLNDRLNNWLKVDWGNLLDHWLVLYDRLLDYIVFRFGHEEFDLAIRNDVIDLVITTEFVLVVVFNCDSIIFVDLILIDEFFNDLILYLFHSSCLKDELEFVE